VNNWIGAIIVFLYFTNYHICKLIYNSDVEYFWHLKVSIYCLIILLAFEYKKKNIFIEKLFLAMIANNIIALVFNKETTYSINDVFFIATFTALQYIKSLKIVKKWLKL
jgi:hypothetical protein